MPSCLPLRINSVWQVYHLTKGPNFSGTEVHLSYVKEVGEVSIPLLRLCAFSFAEFLWFMKMLQGHQDLQLGLMTFGVLIQKGIPFFFAPSLSWWPGPTCAFLVLWLFWLFLSSSSVPMWRLVCYVAGLNASSNHMNFLLSFSHLPPLGSCQELQLITLGERISFKILLNK